MPEPAGPTSSPQTNLLIALCQQAIESRQVPGQLPSVLESREEGLEQARGDFVAKLQEQGDAHGQIFQKEIEDVLVAFDGYREALLGIRRFLHDGATGPLQQGVARLIEVTPQLVAALDAYEAKFMVVGPSQYPIVNIWMKISDAARSGQLNSEALLTMVNGAREFFQKCASEIEEHPDPTAGNAMKLLLEGYRTFLTGMNEYESYARNGDRSHLDQGLELVRRSHEKMQEGYDAYRDLKVTGGPTRSPLANTVINAAAGIKEGHFGDDMLHGALELLEPFFLDIRHQVETLAQVPTESAWIRDLLPKVEQAFTLHEEATAELHRWFEDHDTRHLDAGMATLTGAAGLIAELEDAFKQVGEREGKVFCIKCGAANDATHRVCSTCQAALPRPVGPVSTVAVEESGDAADDETVLTENIQRLYADSNAVAAGRMRPEDYVRTLEWMEGLLHAAEEASRTTPAPDELRERFQETIAEFRGGLAELFAFTQDGDTEHLQRGMDVIWGASRVMQQIQRTSTPASEEVIPSSGA
ncbi:MAG: hypothetical protein ACYCW6_25685 [Candidatus Xenobia bacterium]